jgi:hypothetical protein
MSLPTYEQLIAHILGNSKLKDLLKQVCEKKQYLDNHRPRSGFEQITHLLLVAPINEDGSFSGEAPWVSKVFGRMLEPYAEWGHCKNPLVLEADGNLHISTAARGDVIRNQPKLNEVFLANPKYFGKYPTEANLVISLETMETLLA